jgi:hypothetical protein
MTMENHSAMISTRKNWFVYQSSLAILATESFSSKAGRNGEINCEFCLTKYLCSYCREYQRIRLGMWNGSMWLGTKFHKLRGNHQSLTKDLHHGMCKTVNVNAVTSVSATRRSNGGLIWQNAFSAWAVLDPEGSRKKPMQTRRAFWGQSERKGFLYLSHEISPYRFGKMYN